MTGEVPAENHRLRFWVQLVLALGLIAIGILWPLVMLGVGLGVGSRSDPSYDWLYRIAESLLSATLFVTPSLVGIGVIWVLTILVRRFQFWGQPALALGLILVGVLCWLLGLSLVEEVLFLGGPVVVGVGVIWVSIILVHRFLA